MQKIIGLKNFRENVSTYAEIVEQGISFVVVKRSHPIFKISPVEKNEEQWETVIDFTKIKKRGVPIQEVLQRMQ